MKVRSKTRRRGVLLFSGGIDSALSAIVLGAQNVELIALTITYPRRPIREIRAARNVQRKLPFLAKYEVKLETGGPLVKFPRTESWRAGWIPYRNLLFWAIAAHKAVMLDADFIAAGHDDDDAASFSDASPEFLAGLGHLLKFSGVNTANNLAVELPVYTASLELLETIARQNRKIIDMTWSCWRNGQKPCEMCHACNERQKFLRGLT